MVGLTDERRNPINVKANGMQPFLGLCLCRSFLHVGPMTRLLIYQSATVTYLPWRGVTYIPCNHLIDTLHKRGVIETDDIQRLKPMTLAHT